MECSIRIGGCVTPMWRHDCQKCTFIGRILHDNRDYDVYRTCEGNYGDVLIRYGNDGPEYTSMPQEFYKHSGDEVRRTAALMVEFYGALTTLSTAEEGTQS